MSGLKTSLPDGLAAAVKATADDGQSGGKMQRLLTEAARTRVCFSRLRLTIPSNFQFQDKNARSEL